MASTFTFENHDHTTGTVVCDYLDKDARVRASGYVVRDNSMILQVDADDAAGCVHDALQRILADLGSLRRSLVAAAS
jgi:DNA-directed RNA polymerase subunit L